MILMAICGFILFTILNNEAQVEKPSLTLEKGIGQYKHENYDEALPTLLKAVEEAPNSTLASYYLGLNYKQLQNFKAAIPNLRIAVTKSPKIKGALIELIDCLYRYNELEEANKWILEAEREGIRPAQVSFLKGLVRQKEGKMEEAITSFEKAKKLDSTMVQAGNYQIGLAHLKEKKFDKAEKSFGQVALILPSSNLAKYANEYLNALDRRRDATQPWRYTFGMFWQYDDNVVLKPGDESLAVDIASAGDSRQVYTVQIENNRRSEDNEWGLKNQYNLYISDQNDLSFYDTVVNSFSIQPNRYTDNSVLSFPVTYSHSIVDSRGYLHNPTLGTTYNHIYNNENMGQVFLRYGYKNYLFTPSTDDENRDANTFDTGLGWFRFFDKRNGFYSFRYAYNQEWTKGDNWDYSGNRLSATALIPIEDLFKITLSGSTYFQDFKNVHTVFGESRDDIVYTASTMLNYELNDSTELRLQYTYVRDDSNLSVFDYVRNIYSTGVQFKF